MAQIMKGETNTKHATANSGDTNNLQLQLVTNLNKKHEILTILQLCKSHLKLQHYNTNNSSTTDLLINNYLYLINKLNYKPFQVIWNLGKIYQQKDLYHLSVALLKDYLDVNQSKIKYEDSFDEFIKQDISIQDLQLIQLDQEDQDSDDLIISEVWASLGHCYLMIEDLPNAYLTYQKALYILPNVKCSKLWKGIGVLYDRYGSLDYAEEAFAKVLEIENNQDTLLKEDQNEIYFRLGIIYKHQNKYQQSLECFRFIINNPPPPLKECDIWFQLGQVCELMQDYENAKLAYTESCLLNGNHHKGWICLAVMYLVLQEAKINSFMDQGLNIDEEIARNEDSFFEETKMALQCLNNHLRIDANDTLCWYYLGRAHLLLRDYQTSYEYYQNCINKDPNNANFWCSIGILYYAIGQFHDSLDAYSRAIRLNPYLWEVWYDLGVLYEACGDEEQQFKDAIDAFTQADRLRPNYYATETKLKHLSGGSTEVVKELPKWLEPELPFQQTPQQNNLPQAQFPLDQPINQEQDKRFDIPGSIVPVSSGQLPVPARMEQSPSLAPGNNNLSENNISFSAPVATSVSFQEPVSEATGNKGLDSLVAAAAMSHSKVPKTLPLPHSSTSLTNLAPAPKKRGRKPKSLTSASTTPVSEDPIHQQNNGVKKRGRPLGRKNKVNVDISSLAPINPVPVQSVVLPNKLPANVTSENRLPMFNSVLNKTPSTQGKGVKLNVSKIASISAPSQAQKQVNGIVSIGSNPSNSNNSTGTSHENKSDNRLLNLVRAAESHSLAPRQQNPTESQQLKNNVPPQAYAIGTGLQQKNDMNNAPQQTSRIPPQPSALPQLSSSIGQIPIPKTSLLGQYPTKGLSIPRVELQGQVPSSTALTPSTAPDPPSSTVSVQVPPSVPVETPSSLPVQTSSSVPIETSLTQPVQAPSLLPVPIIKTPQEAVGTSVLEKAKDESIPLNDAKADLETTSITPAPGQKSDYESNAEEEEVEDLPPRIDVEVGEVIRNVEEDENYDD